VVVYEDVGAEMLDVVITSMGKRVKDKDTTFMEQLIQSLDTGATKDYQLITVENASPYANAVNLGLEQTENDVLLLNDDIVLFDDWERIEKGKGDIRGFKLIYPEPRLIQHAGGFLSANFDARHFGHYCWDTSLCLIAAPCHFVTFGAVYIKREVIEKLGGVRQFGTIFFEDVDYCLRAWQAGFTVFYNPVTAVHYERMTMGRDDKEAIQETYKEAYGNFAKIWYNDDKASETLTMLDEGIKKAWLSAYGKKAQ